MDYEALLSHCDSLIKAGKISTVGDALADLNSVQIPRKWRQAFAKICRRSGRIEQGLKLLYPIIRSEHALDKPAENGEICEYAVLLSRNGSIQEALSLLSKVDDPKVPEAMLYRAFCYISSWDYAEATIHLEEFLNSSADNYSKLIGRVNLAAAYVATRNLVQAETLLTETIELAKTISASRLVGNCLELRGQVALLREDFPLARTELNSALEIFNQSGSYDQLLIFKWQAVMNSQEKRSTQPLKDFKEEALKRAHWESAREADLFQLKLEFDQKLFDHIFFGTPSESYRKRICDAVIGQPGSEYVLGVPGGPELNLGLGIIKGEHQLNPGKKIHQLISVMLKDFYAPRNLGTLFAELYPDEFFNINSSPLRLRQLIRRTRRWLEENNLPAQIVEENGSYRFSITGPLSIRIPSNRDTIANLPVKWKSLSEIFRSDLPFTADEACVKLNLSRSGFHRLAEWAIGSGELEKTGTGRSTQYRIKCLLKIS